MFMKLNMIENDTMKLDTYLPLTMQHHKYVFLWFDIVYIYIENVRMHEVL